MIFLFRGWKRVFSRVFFSNRPFESLSPLLLSGARLLAFLSNKRILQLRSSFSGQEEGGGRNGCCSATKAVIARTFVLLSEGCRRRRDTGASPRLASLRLPSPRLAHRRRRRSHKSGPTVFPGGSNAYRVFRVSRSREEGGRSERREEERRRKKDGGEREKERSEKKVLGAAKVREHTALCTRYAVDCTEGKNLLGTVSCRS